MWDKAYLEQARSDWATRELLAKNGCTACHDLHYLQMATEKLGKAGLLRGGGKRIEDVWGTHKVFVEFLRTAAKNPSLQRALEFKSLSQLRHYVNDILPLAREIEKLAPTLAGTGPNAEYPWEGPSQVHAPASFDFPILSELYNHPDGRKLQRMIKIVLERFDEFF
jgi:hypothetical protein